MQPLDPNKIYSLDELSEIFKVSRNTIRIQFEDKKEGGIPFYQVGDQYRVVGSNVLKAFGSVTYQAPSQPDQNYQSTAGVPAQSGS